MHVHEMGCMYVHEHSARVVSERKVIVHGSSGGVDVIIKTLQVK